MSSVATGRAAVRGRSSGARRAALALAAVVCLARGSSGVCLAQSRTTSALAGRVTDGSGGALPGAIVEIESTALIGGARTGRTDENGRYRFAELPPGAYDLKVILPGYKTIEIEEIRLSVGLSTEVPVVLIAWAGQETVHVRAEAVGIDPTSSAPATILPREVLRNIPNDRDPSHIFDLAPGINIESAYGGGEESGNAYQMDGVDISDPDGGAPWSFFSYNLFDEVQLVGLGAPAEYGEFTGVVFNSTTKSGANEFAGSAELIYSGKALTGSNSDSSGLAASIQQHVEGSFDLGGPIRQDRLWYFVSGQYVHDVSTEGGPDQTEDTPRLFAKLTWQASPNNDLQGWLEYDHTKITGRDGDAFTPLEATAGEDNPELVWNLAWRSVLSANAILSVAGGGYSGSQHFDPHNGFSTPGRVDAQTDLASGNARVFGLLDRDRNQLNVSLSQHAHDFIRGDHDFKFGMEIERSVVRNQYGYPGGAFYYDNAGPAIDPGTGLPDYYTLQYLGGGYDVHAKNQRVSLYAQDSWRITPRITINPGLRYDINRGSVPGQGNVFTTDGLAARLGFAWDPSGKGRFVIRGHYGRYYEALYASFYDGIDSGAFGPLTITRFFNTSGSSQSVSASQGQKFEMDPDIRQPRLDQYILGFDRELPRSLVLSATLVYRRNSDLIETVSRSGRFAPVSGRVPESGQKVTLYDALDPGGDVLLYTNPPELHRAYRAAILSLTRRMSDNWQLFASYVYSKTTGNIDNLGFDELGIGANTPSFFGGFLDTPNSLVNAEGKLTHDQTHQVKLQGTWIVPSLDLSFSGSYTFHSGDTWTPRTDCLLTDDGNGVIGDGITGCHSFPQGPVLYFAEPRGSRRLPSRNELDLRAEWQHDLGAGKQFSLGLDVLNVTNQGRATEVETTVGDELGQPATFNFPRNARFTAGFTW